MNEKIREILRYCCFFYTFLCFMGVRDGFELVKRLLTECERGFKDILGKQTYTRVEGMFTKKVFKNT